MSKSVHDLCIEREISLLELADQAGLELTRVQAIYLGRYTPSPEQREAIARVLKVDAQEVAWGHKTPIQHIYGHGPG